MSIKIMTLISERLDVSGGQLALALAIGDFSDDNGESIFPSVKRLAFRSRQDRRTVQRQLAHFREVGWLQVITDGGLTGGRGNATEYRINPEWVKGGKLTLFPDVQAYDGDAEKGDKLTPFPPDNSGTMPPIAQERAASGTEKGGIHDTKGRQSLPPHPSGSINDPKSAAARAIPSGSRAAPAKEAPPYDPIERKRYWYSRHAMPHLLGECRPLGITTDRPTRLEDLPTNVRALMPDKMLALAAQAVEWERPPAVKGYNAICRHIEQEITTELRVFAKRDIPPATKPWFEEPVFRE